MNIDKIAKFLSDWYGAILVVGIILSGLAVLNLASAQDLKSYYYEPVMQETVTATGTLKTFVDQEIPDERKTIEQWQAKFLDLENQKQELNNLLSKYAQKADRCN